jgi:hypothetical protein
MRAGESDTATTLLVEGPTVALGQQVGALTRHRGILGIVCIERDGLLQVLDLYPRFTGDHPFSHLAGANIPQALLALVASESPRPESVRPRKSWMREISPSLRRGEPHLPEGTEIAPEIRETPEKARTPVGPRRRRVRPEGLPPLSVEGRFRERVDVSRVSGEG